MISQSNHGYIIHQYLFSDNTTHVAKVSVAPKRCPFTKLHDSESTHWDAQNFLILHFTLVTTQFPQSDHAERITVEFHSTIFRWSPGDVHFNNSRPAARLASQLDFLRRLSCPSYTSSNLTARISYTGIVPINSS